MANVRVKLTFPNPTENCWFLINTASDRVIGDIETRLAARFDKNDDSLRLYLDGCWLPTEESTLLLRDNDNISIRFTKGTIETDNHRAVPQEQHSASKREPDVVTKLKKEKRKSKEDISLTLDLPTSCHVEANEENDCKGHRKKHKSEHKKNKRQAEEVDDQETECNRNSPTLCHVEANEENDCKSHRKKHKSEHKKKKHREGEADEQDMECKMNKRTRTDFACVSESTPSHTEKRLDITKTMTDTPKVTQNVDTTMIVADSGNSGDNNAQSPDTGVSEKLKRKRKRRKRKTSTKTAIVVSELCSTPFARAVLPTSGVATNGPSTHKIFATGRVPHLGTSLDFGEGAKHVHFDLDQETSNQEDPHSTTNNVTNSTPTTAMTESAMDVTEAAHLSPTHQTITAQTNSQSTTTQEESGPVVGGEEVGSTNTPLHNLMENMSGYKVVPPPSDYKPVHQHATRGGRGGGRNESSANLLQGAPVFNRRLRRCKKSGFVPLSKEEQLNTSATNRSTVYQNSPDTSQQGEAGVSEKSDEPPKDYASMQELHGLPREKDKIAFKVLEISDTCTPEMSDFQEATVLHYDAITKMVHLELINPTKVPRKPLPFDVVVEDDEGILTNVADELTRSYSWTSLMDVRLLPSS